MRKTFSAFSLILFGLQAATASALEIRGDYVEARTADVFTGPCFSNAEVFIYGNRAVMAWKVTEGSWNGVDLRGLCVAAAVDGTTTFSEDQPEKAASVLMVDRKADARQREALIAMAKTFGGARLSRIAKITTVHMSLKLETHAPSERETAHETPRNAPFPSRPRSGRQGSPRSSLAPWTSGTTLAATRWWPIPRYPRVSAPNPPTRWAILLRAKGWKRTGKIPIAGAASSAISHADPI